MLQHLPAGVGIDRQREQEVIDVGVADAEPGRLLHGCQGERVHRGGGPGESAHEFRRGATMVGSMRFACFLCTA